MVLSQIYFQLYIIFMNKVYKYTLYVKFKTYNKGAEHNDKYQIT